MTKEELGKEAEKKARLWEHKNYDYECHEVPCLPWAAYKKGYIAGVKSREKQLTKAKELLKRVIKFTWGEGWNYSLSVKVEAEKFLNDEGCPDCFCEDCTKEDCRLRDIGLLPKIDKEKEKGETE